MWGVELALGDRVARVGDQANSGYRPSANFSPRTMLAFAPALYDKATAATPAGVPAIGTRIEIEWSHPRRFEGGTVAEHITELDGKNRTIVLCRVVYDDGTCGEEDLRRVNARPMHDNASTGAGSE